MYTHHFHEEDLLIRLYPFNYLRIPGDYADHHRICHRTFYVVNNITHILTYSITYIRLLLEISQFSEKNLIVSGSTLHINCHLINYAN